MRPTAAAPPTSAGGAGTRRGSSVSDGSYLGALQGRRSGDRAKVFDLGVVARPAHQGAQASTGSFVLVPGNVTHDFENRGSERAGALNVSAPGNFEQHMPGIAQWFAEHPPGDTRI